MLLKSKDSFAGDRKKLDHFVLHFEKKMITAFLPLVPSWMSTVHLTLMTFLWAIGVVAFGYLSQNNIWWLWGFSLCIFLQYITDMLDGAVGRMRGEGLVRWGFYLDHFLDYLFMSSIIIGYSFILPAAYSFLVLVCLVVFNGFMIHVLIDFSITNDFKISFNRFGVSETRYVLIIFNTILVFMGKELLLVIFPLVVLAAFIALSVIVYKSQNIYRAKDMDFLKREIDALEEKVREWGDKTAHKSS